MASICNIDGCERRHLARGMCGTHYQRWRSTGNPHIGKTSFSGDGMAFIDRHLSHHGDDCLIWPYARNAGGYGVTTGPRTRLAHRIMCFEANGEPPQGKNEAAHSCGNGHLGCVNPRHLSWKTRAENEADRITHGTSQHGERNAMAKLTVPSVLDAIARASRGEPQRSIADSYGVTPSAISSIIRGKSWQHLGRN